MNSNTDGLSWIGGMREVDRDSWNLLAAPYGTPLLDYDWLRLLEDSGVVSPDSGWIPQHLLLFRNNRLIAAAPLYVKVHSEGEFVFDYAWADVAMQLGVPYYPKLVAMSPLTPAVGYRFLVAKEADEDEVIELMLGAIDDLCRANDLHGISILWPDPAFADAIRTREFCSWRHQHFRWENDSLDDFDSYLAGFTKNQRRNIRRERASIAAQGLSVRVFSAAEADDETLDRMYDYYTTTNDQFGEWAARYLNREFFERLGAACPDQVLFVGAYENSNRLPVGLSMLLRGPQILIGRYWGAARFVNHLHFNLCYYEPIDWGIRNGIQVFDPGMGSSHKIRRGFRAIATESLHRFYDPRMVTLMKMNIDRINEYEQLRIDELNSFSPLAGNRTR